MKRLICAANVRRTLLELAKLRRAHKFTRVSQATLDQLEAELRGRCEAIVQTAPSKGVTL